MTSIASILLLLLLVAPGADAAFYREGMSKPVRGQYRMTTKQRSSRARSSAPAVRNVTFKDKTLGITLVYPNDWKATSVSGKSPMITIKPAGDRNTLKERRQSVMQVMVESLPRGKDKTLKELDTYMLSRATLAPGPSLGDWYIPSFNLLESGDATLLGYPARRYVYTGEHQSVKYVSVRYLASFNGKLYSALLRAEPAYAEEDQAAFERVVASLTPASSASSSSARRVRTRRR